MSERLLGYQPTSVEASNIPTVMALASKPFSLTPDVVAEVKVQDDEDRQARNGTAIHEAEHTALAEETDSGSVALASNIGGKIGNTRFNGITKTTRYNALAFAGPLSQGRSGTSHDESVIRMMGDNPHAASTAASRVLAKIRPVTNAIAVAIEDERVVYGPKIRWVIRQTKQKIENKKRGIHNVTVSLTHRDGRKLSYETTSNANTVRLSGEVVGLFDSTESAQSSAEQNETSPRFGAWQKPGVESGITAQIARA